SWFAEVTIASATSGLVSDTRAIGAPMSTTAERPTISFTDGVPSSSAAKTRPGTVTATRRMKSERGCRTLIRIVLLLAHGLVRAFVPADDFDGRNFRRRRRDDRRARRDLAGGELRAHGGALHRRLHAEQRRRTDAVRGRRRLVERVAQRQLNLALRARERQALGLFGIDQQRHDGHRHRLVLVGFAL